MLMDALCIVEPRRVEYRAVPRPTPGPGEALVRVAAVGCCGSDLATFRGLNPLAGYPRIPGHEVSGVVEAVGDGVALAPGTPVLVMPYANCGRCTACRAGRANACRSNRTLGVQRDGAMAEYVVAPERALLTAPTLGLTELALVEPVTIGFHACARARVAADETVLVLGCGMIGLGAIAGAQARGARVVAVDADAGKLAIARRFGAREALVADATLAERVAALTGGDGPAVVIEAAGAAATMRAALELVAFAGRLACIGYAPGPIELPTKLIVQKELDVHGSRNATPDDFRRVIAAFAAGAVPVAQAVTREVAFADAAEALRAWDADPAAVVKLVVRLDGADGGRPARA